MSLISFTESYHETVTAALEAVGDINLYIAQQEPILGSNPKLDSLYVASVLAAGIVEVLVHDDNAEPKVNEKFLMQLHQILGNLPSLPKQPNIVINHFKPNLYE
jgi:hypothetical protein